MPARSAADVVPTMAAATCAAQPRKKRTKPGCVGRSYAAWMVRSVAAKKSLVMAFAAASCHAARDPG